MGFRSQGIFIALGWTLGWALSLAQPPCAQAMAHRRILPLGDALTSGTYRPADLHEQSDGTYRTELYKQFKKAGFKFEFVGSLEGGPADLPDKKHEGHSGWRIDQIAQVAPRVVAQTKPDVVLILLGRNDINEKFELATAPARLLALAAQIEAIRPSAQIFVSALIPTGLPDQDALNKSFNQTLADLMRAKESADSHLHFVDLPKDAAIRDGLAGGPSDLTPDFHPQADAYMRMGDAWYAAIAKVFKLQPPLIVSY